MSRSTGHKKDKMQERILNDVNSFLRFHGNDSRLTFVSVTRVELSPDYSHAKIFWDTFDLSKKDEIGQVIDEMKGKIRSYLAKTLQVRSVPSITVLYDSQYEAEKKIDEILSVEKSKKS